MGIRIGLGGGRSPLHRSPRNDEVRVNLLTCFGPAICGPRSFSSAFVCSLLFSALASAMSLKMTLAATVSGVSLVENVRGQTSSPRSCEHCDVRQELTSSAPPLARVYPGHSGPYRRHPSRRLPNYGTPTTWQGQVAMRVSISNWSTTADIDRSAAAILIALDAAEDRSSLEG